MTGWRKGRSPRGLTGAVRVRARRILAGLAVGVGLNVAGGVAAGADRLSVRDYLALSDSAQELYVSAFMWGSAATLAKIGTPTEATDTCTSADRRPADIVATVRARAITAPPQDGARNVNLVLGEILFEGCRF